MKALRSYRATFALCLGLLLSACTRSSPDPASIEPSGSSIKNPSNTGKPVNAEGYGGFVQVRGSIQTRNGVSTLVGYDKQHDSNENSYRHLTSDSWRPLSQIGAPSPRSNHTVIWSGNTMLVYGGDNGSTVLGDGFAYDPISDSWSPLPNLNSPGPRRLHVALWTGQSMIIWGGTNGFNPTPISEGLQGSLYTPATRTWSRMTLTNAPSQGSRIRGTAVWTGSKMLVWGGFSENYNRPKDIGIYNPTNNSWDTRAAPFWLYNLVDHSAVWTGSKMLVWGGNLGEGDYNQLYTYDPSTNFWSATIPNNSPSPRSSHTAVWTGSKMIIWGGWDSTNHVTLNDGGIYDPLTGLFTPTPLSPLSGRYGHTAVWTGSKMLVWGGYDTNTGATFDPELNSWASMNTVGAPPERTSIREAGIWTGSNFIVFGGENGIQQYFNSGGAYTPHQKYQSE